MTPRNAGVPRLFYALAMLVGFCGLPLSFAVMSYGYDARLAASVFLEVILGGRGAGAWLTGVAVFALPQGVLGALFGYAWPQVGWRWGVWLTALPLCVLTFFVPALDLFVPALALNTLPATAGAYAAARHNLRRARLI